MFAWLRRLFSSEPVLLAGIVTEKWHDDETGGELTGVINGVPIFNANQTEEWMLTFADGQRSRSVAVSKDCWDRYKVGDRIRFEN